MRYCFPSKSTLPDDAPPELRARDEELARFLTYLSLCEANDWITHPTVLSVALLHNHHRQPKLEALRLAAMWLPVPDGDPLLEEIDAHVAQAIQEQVDLRRGLQFQKDVKERDAIVTEKSACPCQRCEAERERAAQGAQA